MPTASPHPSPLPCLRHLGWSAGLCLLAATAHFAAAAEQTAPEIVTQPVAQIIAAGSDLHLSIIAQGSEGLKYQWKKNNANVGGGTSPELTIPAVKSTNAGSYKCVVTSTVNGKAASVSSSEAQVAIVDTAPKAMTVAANARTSLSATAAGNSITFQWFRGAEAITGANTKTYVLTSPQASDSGSYSCLITAPGGSLAGGISTLTVYNEAPVITLSEGASLPAGIVSETYEFTVPVDPAMNRTPTAFTAAGLPAGLTINKTTGAISGKPTASKAAPFTATLTASNAKGKSSVKVNLEIAPLNANLVGTYMGILSRFMDLNEKLGGRLDMTTATTGAFSGKLLLGANNYPFNGRLDADPANPLVATGAATVKRAGKLPLTLTFTLDAESNWISQAQITDGGAVLEFNGWRNVWSKMNPATLYGGYYTFGLALPDTLLGDAGVPQGHGYGSFTLPSATGKLTFAGKLADGTGYTAATFAGPDGEVGFFQTLYTPATRGSLVGILFIGYADPATDNQVYGGLSWWYPGSAAANARVYSGGFEPIDLTLEGAVYSPPASPKVVLGIDESTEVNSQLTFSAPYSDFPAPLPNLGVAIGARSKLTLPKGIDNPRKTTLAVNARTGGFSGGFSLVDPNLLQPGKTVTRSVSYSGMIVRDPFTGAETGKGFFMLPERPASAGETASRTQILSGSVLLESANLQSEDP